MSCIMYTHRTRLHPLLTAGTSGWQPPGPLEAINCDVCVDYKVHFDGNRIVIGDGDRERDVTSDGSGDGKGNGIGYDNDHFDGDGDGDRDVNGD